LSAADAPPAGGAPRLGATAALLAGSVLLSRALGLARATEPRFNWATIAEQFNSILTETILEGQQAPVGLEVGR